MIGNPGTGKDHLLCALMWYAILRYGFSVEWQNGMELSSRMRDRIGEDDAEPEERIIKRLVKPHILVFSDPVPPKGEVGRYQAEILYSIIDQRYRAMKPTWVSANVYGGDDARNKIADNIVDRLRHDSLVINCDWESYRTPS